MNSPDLPLFPLASWELPPDSTEPLVAPATLRWRGTLFGRETDWLLRLIPSNDLLGELFVRAEDESEAGSYWFGIQFIMPDECQQVASLEHEMRWNSSRVPQWRRIFFERASQSYGATANSTELEVFVVGCQAESARLEVRWPFEFNNASSAQVRAAMLRHCDDDSDLGFACRWLLLPPGEKVAMVVQWQRGNELELRALMGVVLRALGPTISPFTLEWQYRPESKTWFMGQHIDEEWWEPMDEGLASWEDALPEFFGISWNNELAVKHRCVRIYEKREFVERFQVLCVPPTAHEQLEAARELSIWLDERAARRELAAELVARLRATLR